MRAPKRDLFVGPAGEQTRIVLSGDLFACMSYEEVTGGETLEEAAIGISPTAKRTDDPMDPATMQPGYMIPVTVTAKAKAISTRQIADLLFAFSATWRDDTRWNDKHHREGDPRRPPRDRAEYVDLVKLLTVDDKRRAQTTLLGLLMQTVFPPGETATESEPAAR